MDAFLLNVFLFVKDNKEPTFYEEIYDVIFKNRFLIYTWLCLVPAAYIFEVFKYRSKFKKYVNVNTINLGQITVQGDLSKVLDGDHVALILRSEFTSIQQTLHNIESEKLNASPAQAGSVDYYFFFSGIREESDKDGMVTHQNTIIPDIKGLVKPPKIQTNIILGFKSFKIPVSEIFRTSLKYIGLLIPIGWRTEYNNSLINISVMSHEKFAKVIVYRYESSKGKSQEKKDNNNSLTCSGPFNTIKEINNLLRNVAFMVLKLHNDSAFQITERKSMRYLLDRFTEFLRFRNSGLVEDRNKAKEPFIKDSVFQNTEWKSMRYLLDGFTEFSRFRNSGLVKDRNNAKELFIKALAEDSENNLEAMYYLAVMLMVDRTTTSIEKAISYFNNALRTEKSKFKSFINLGLSFCYAQSFHRLGKTNNDMIDKADKALQEAKKFWEKKIEEDRTKRKKDSDKEVKELPLLPYMNGMIRFVKAGGIKYNTKRKKAIMLEGLKFTLEASALDPSNSMFKNNVGWVLMQLSMAKVTEIPSGYIPKEKKLVTALLAERYLLEALLLNPQNKLTHANLALLYSIPYFRKQDDEHEFAFLKSRFHGLKAIKLDARYINAYRDVCITYLRFKKYELAKEYFYKTLEVAESPLKDGEVLRCLIKEAKDNKAPEELIKRWSNPKLELFEPH